MQLKLQNATRLGIRSVVELNVKQKNENYIRCRTTFSWFFLFLGGGCVEKFETDFCLHFFFLGQLFLLSYLLSLLGK